MLRAPVEEVLQTKLVNAIIDWRDADNLARLEGAEKEEYKDAGLSYQPSNKPFQTIEELQLVLGMNEQVYNWLESLVTVYSGQPSVDLNLAAREVLQVLPGVDAGLIDGYIAARRESAIYGSPAPVFGMTVASQPAVGAAIGSMSDNNVTEQKGVVTVVTEARLDNGITVMIKALIKRADIVGSPPFQTLKWRRSTVVNTSLFADEKDQLLVRQYSESEFNN
jgi:general secretion pathway protein K